MQIADLLTPERIACKVDMTSKKRALEFLSGLIVQGSPDLDEADVFASLLGRERLGSTGLGHRVALPHGRISTIDRAVGAFVTLAEGIDFDAIDDEPVDLMFGLVVPEQSTNEHLVILAQLAELFRNEDFCRQLREATSGEQLFALLSNWRSTDSSAA